MHFRATSFAVGQRAIQFSARHNANLLQYQEQISSGLRLQRPSDDPIAFRQIASLTSRISELAADTQSINSVESVLNTSTVQMQEFANVFNRAKVLAQQGVQALDDGERNALALEVDGLLTQMQLLSETEFDGAYLYGGTRSDQIPYEFGDPLVEGGTLSSIYSGTNENSRAFVGEAVSVDSYYAGSRVFGQNNRGETLIVGSTGTQPGTGTDTIIGRATLQVTHVATNFLGGSGIQTGTSSATNDTIIGDVGTHSVTIVDTAGDGSAGTIRLNNGEAVAFTATDTNLLVSGPGGAEIFVDTTAITAGFNGTVDVIASGNLSVDGGLTQTAIDFSSNQIVTDSTTGRFVTLDTSGTRVAGNDNLEFPGTSDAFQVLFELASDLRNERGLNNVPYTDAISRRLGELDRIADQAFDVLGEQSTSLQALQSLRFRIEDLELAAETQLSEIQSTNIPETVVRMENTQALLQYTYAVTAELTSLGLLDFLR